MARYNGLAGCDYRRFQSTGASLRIMLKSFIMQDVGIERVAQLHKPAPA